MSQKPEKSPKTRGAARPRSLAAMGAVAVLGAAGCEPPSDVTEQQPAPLGVVLSALESSCGGDTNPFSVVTSYRICGQAAVNIPNVGLSARKFFDASASLKEGTLRIGDIPANQGYEVTVVGLNADKQPAFFARQRGVGVAVGETTNLDLTLVPYNNAACLSVEGAGNLPHRVFAASVALPDGRVLVSGGFSAVAGAGSQTLTAASDLTYWVDSKTGEVSPGPRLNTGRGAHEMIHVPSRNAILVIGGASELGWNGDSDALALEYDSTKALKSVEVIDLSGEDAVVLPTEIELQQQRAFPRAARISADRVLVTGGGEWPSSAGSYTQPDLIAWDAESDGFVQDSESVFAQDTAARAGHTLTFLASETSGGTTRDVFVLWGGTTGDQRVSLVTAPTDASSPPVFATASLSGNAAERTFFHSATRLTNNRILVAGGVTFNGGNGGGLKAVNASAAYVLSYSNEGGVTIGVQAVSGLSTGRYFHTATSVDGRRVALIGGFSTLKGGGLAEVAYFDASTLSFSSTPQPIPALAPRGGHTAVLTVNDSYYLAGGIEEISDLAANERMLSDIFVPGAVQFCDAPAFSEDEVTP